MSLNTNENTPTGFRRIGPEMLAIRDWCDGFGGVPKGTAKPLTFLAAFQEAEPYLGLPAHAFKLVAWLVKQTMAHDWEEGSRPIAWPCARRQQEFLGLSKARVKILNRTLYEAGIFVLRDNEQGKRYGRRGPDKRIIEAYGFDLSPLALRYDEFVRLAAEAKAERGRMKALRARVTIARRAIRQAGEWLAGSVSAAIIDLDAERTRRADPARAIPPTATERQAADWRRFTDEMADLVDTARRCDRSDTLEPVARRLEALKAEAEQWLKATLETVETSPEGLVSEPHTTSTNPTLNLKDTVIAAEKSSEADRPKPAVQTPRERQGSDDFKVWPVAIERLKLSVEELVHLVPRLGAHIRSNRPTWSDAVDAAGGPLRCDLGVSPSLWAEACTLLGRDGATLALAIVAAKADSHFTASPGGYFGGMVRRAAKGELYLEKSLWGLRTSKYGRPSGDGPGKAH